MQRDMTPQRWRQIEELYYAARKRPVADRAAYLAEACRGDEHLRREVESLLAQDPTGKNILSHPAASLLPDVSNSRGGLIEQVGPYKIEGLLGKGGMGVVYRALDTKLNRPVAVKFLSDELADAAARRRFQREAQTASSLNHPHIITVHDAGELETQQYLVTELVDGGTFRDWTKTERRDWRQIVELLVGVADGLATAHEAGILHRDVKPENILISRSGYAKLADFGLAKLAEAPPGDITRTVTEHGTRPGVAVGTIPYMSPEQAAGKPLDARSDIFSFGVVLYEALSGQRPFAGTTDLELLQTIIHGSAQPLPTEVPASLRTVVEKALEKNPGDRYQSMREMVVDLRRLLRSSAETATPPQQRSLWPWKWAAPVAVLLVAGGAAWKFWPRTGPRSTIPDPSSFIQLTSFTDSVVEPVLSPDGRMLAFYRSSSRFETSGDIWLKLLPNGEPIRVTHDPRPKYNIAFSPDGSRIAYSVFPAASKLFDTYTVSTFGGDSQRFLPNSAGLSWLDERHLLFSQIKTGIHMGIVTANADRSSLREVYFPSLERGMAHYSYLSPDRKWILLQEMNPAWRPCRLVPFSGGSEGREVGPPGATCTAAAWSPDGKCMYLGVQVAGRYHLWRQDFPDGRPEQITFGSNEEMGIAMAPDGQSLITSIVTHQNAIWVHDPQGDRAISTEGYAEYARPVFSRDGKRLYYLMRRESPESPAELWRTDLDSGNSEVVAPGVSMREFDISKDEKQVVFFTQPAGQPSELWIAALDRNTPPRRIASGVDAPHFGPNGEVFFRVAEGKLLYVDVVAEDGSGWRKALPGPVLGFNDVSPNGQFLSGAAAVPNITPPPIVIFPLNGNSPIPICYTLCEPTWSQDGHYLYLRIADDSGQNRNNSRTVSIPLPPGQILPRLTPELIRDPAGWAKMPGVKVTDGVRLAPGPNPSTYAYIKPSFHANLYRIPLR